MTEPLRNGKIELMAPAGSFEAIASAYRAGADSIYFGVGRLNMRARASYNFTEGDIRKISTLCRRSGMRAYLALNTIIYDDDIPEMRRLVDTACGAGLSGIIASDIAVMEYARSKGMEVHVSVQANIANTESLRLYSRYADVAVLARELTLEKISAIAGAVKEQDIRGPSGKQVRLELFVHGALCISVAGVCHMSLANYNTSANRGDCFQNCRRKYKVVDDETGFEMALDNSYVMSPKDLCTIRILDMILASGVTVLKIEGRGRGPDYVHNVVSAYRKAVDMWLAGTFTGAGARELETGLETVFNRGFWHGGYYLGDRTGEWSGISGNRSKVRKSHAGGVENYFPKAGVAQVRLAASDLRNGDTILVTGRTTGALRLAVDGMLIDGVPVANARKGATVTFPVPEKVRRGDKVYRLDEGSGDGTVRTNKTGDPR